MMMIVLQNTVREIVHRRHTKTTVGTTLKGHYWIEQYRLIQYIDGGYTNNIDTVNRRQDRDMEVARSASGGRSMTVYVSPISSKTLRGASASCRRRKEREVFLAAVKLQFTVHES